MYAEGGLLFPYMQNWSPDFQQLDEYCNLQKSDSSVSNLSQSSVSEYDFGGEGDLFKAPAPIIEAPVMCIDPMIEAISMVSCVEEVINRQELKVDIESIESEQWLREVLYECERDLMEKAAIESPLSEVLDVKIPVEITNENSLKPSILDLPAQDFGNAYGMRRAFSEGDIKTIGIGNINTIPLPIHRPVAAGGCASEDRKEKLSRYRNKKTKRNFGRKIKYACRKALADSQPRIRGRFAKTEESNFYKRP